jgi:D-alanine-D-alanine ligase
VVAADVDEATRARIDRMCRRVYRILGLNGYARMDLRLEPSGRIWLLEANPNPDLACDEDFAESAVWGGIPYERLIRRIVALGLRHHAEGR